MSFPVLDLDLLQAFVAMADHRSFTRAATPLNHTQSAVSMQIRRLEDRLGEAFDAVIAMHPEGRSEGEFLRREQAVWAAGLSYATERQDPLPVALYPQPAGTLLADHLVSNLTRPS